MDYYRRNMRVLKRNHRALYNRIRNYNQSDKVIIEEKEGQQEKAIVKDLKNELNIYIEETRSADYTIRVENQDRDIYFHSKYDPQKEAKRRIENFELRNEKQIFALGFGLGYHLNEVANRDKFDRIIIIEPVISILYTALNFVDLKPLLKKEKVIFVVEGRPKIFDIIQKCFSLSLEKELAFLEQSPSLKFFENEYKDVYQNIREGINYKKTGMVTNITQSRKWRNNMIISLPHIFKSPKANDFFNTFEDIPAICVSAGPSLDKNIDLIKEVEGKALIICVDSAFIALIKHNIKPDIVVAMDGNRGDFDNFKRWPNLINLENIYLFSELGNYYGIPKIWSGPKVFFTMKRNFSGWIENLKGEYTPIHTGGTVAHSMVDLAYRFGSDPIVLVGQDLAYDNEKKYVSGIGREDMTGSDDEELKKVPGIDDSFVYTDKSFMTMINYFNNYFSKRPDRKYIDATEGGALIKHTEIMKLEKVIDKYCNNESQINVKERLDNKYSKSKPDMEIIEPELKEEIKNTIKELDEAIGLAKEQLKLINNIEKQLKCAKEISDKQLEKIIKKVTSYESEFKKFYYIKFFIERTLIVESMRYKEVKTKFYMNNLHALKEKMKYYRSYRVKYLKELEKCRDLFAKNYTKKDRSKKVK